MQIPLELQEHCYRLLHAQRWADVLDSVCSCVTRSEKSCPGSFQTWLFHGREPIMWKRIQADSDSNEYDEIESANWGGFSRDAVANEEQVWIQGTHPFLYKNATYVIGTKVSTFSTSTEVTEQDPDALWAYY